MTATADAIRAKTGDSAQIPFDYNGGTGFADAVEAIPQGGGFDMTVEPNQVKALVYIDEYTLSIQSKFLQTVANSVSVDFGDGTPVVVSSDTVAPSYPFDNFQYSHGATADHTYNNAGWYVITWTVNDGVMGIYGYNPEGSVLICDPNQIGRGGDNENMFAQASKYSSCIVELNVGANVEMPSMSVSNMRRLTKLYSPFPTMGAYQRYVGLPNIQIPEGTETVVNQYLQEVATYYIKVPSTLKEISANMFRSSRNCLVFDFTAISLENGSLPFVVGTTPFFGINDRAPAKILFKDAETAAVAKVTTNLASYASYIHYVGE